MRKLAAVFLLAIAPALRAQETVTPQGPMPSFKGAWELGIYPMTRNVTSDIGRRDKWGHGFTALVGNHFSDVFSWEVAFTGGWMPQINRRTDMSVNFYSPSVALSFQPWTDNKWGPYVLGGASYEIYRFQRIPANADVRDLDFISGHAGAGLRYRLAHNAALRMELNSEFGNQRPTFGAMMGVSFMRGARRPTPAMRTVTNIRTDTIRIAPPPPRVDTVRIVRVDTVFRGEVLLSLDDVNFDYDQSTLRPEAGPILDRAAADLASAAWAAIQIEVVGFTDSRGTDDYNLRLGMRRAKAVADYLTGKGIAAGRITILSGGEGSPVADNNTDTGRAQNRRVIIKRGINR